MSEPGESASEKTLILTPGEVPQGTRPPDAWLLCTEPAQLANESAREIRVTGEGATLGRSDDNAVVIRADGVSRHHARVYPGEGCWGIEDLRSRNGIAVNKKRVKTAWLKDGDVVQIGNVPYRFVVEAPDAKPRSGARKSDVTGIGDRTLVLRPEEAEMQLPERGEDRPGPAAASPAARKPAPRKPAPRTPRNPPPESEGIPAWVIVFGLLGALIAAMMALS